MGKFIMLRSLSDKPSRPQKWPLQYSVTLPGVAGVTLHGPKEKRQAGVVTTVTPEGNGLMTSL
jgi:hypothetical protein